jgi:hypothetical protein
MKVEGDALPKALTEGPERISRLKGVSLLSVSPLFFACQATLARQFAQGDDEVTRGALQSVGASFEAVRVGVGTHGDGRERLLYLPRQTPGLGLGLLLGARHRKV